MSKKEEQESKADDNKQSSTEALQEMRAKKEAQKEQKTDDTKTSKKSSGKKKATPKKTEVKLEVTFDDLIKRVKELSVATHLDTNKFLVVRPLFGKVEGKVVTYVQMTKKGISFYQRTPEKAWEVAPNKMTVPKHVDQFIDWLKKQITVAEKEHNAKSTPKKTDKKNTKKKAK